MNIGRLRHEYDRQLPMTAPVEVSIVVCTRNRARALAGCLEALAQIESSRSWELLIIDNASTDDTAEVLASADDCDGRMRVLKVDRIGLGSARDAAWRAARGTIIAFTDDDCYVDSDYVDAMLVVFEEDAELACAAGRIVLHDKADIPVAINEQQYREEIAPFSFVPPGKIQGANFAVRRSVLESIGGFDTSLGAGTPFPCEDVDVAAAISWSGLRSIYDPRPSVRHHHGRKEIDRPRVMKAYHDGRGAYFAKYMLRSDSREAYRRGWQDSIGWGTFQTGLEALNCEAASAVRYLAGRNEYGFIAACLPFFLVSYSRLISRSVRTRIMQSLSRD